MGPPNLVAAPSVVIPGTPYRADAPRARLRGKCLCGCWFWCSPHRPAGDRCPNCRSKQGAHRLSARKPVDLAAVRLRRSTPRNREAARLRASTPGNLDVARARATTPRNLEVAQRRANNPANRSPAKIRRVSATILAGARKRGLRSR